MDGKKPLRDIFIKLDIKTKTMLLIKMLTRETFCGNTCGWNVSEVHLKLVVRTKDFFLNLFFIELKLIDNIICFVCTPLYFYYLRQPVLTTKHFLSISVQLIPFIQFTLSFTLSPLLTTLLLSVSICLFWFVHLLCLFFIFYI